MTASESQQMFKRWLGQKGITELNKISPDSYTPAGFIRTAFTWSETPQGSDYWYEICKDLTHCPWEGLWNILDAPNVNPFYQQRRLP